MTSQTLATLALKRLSIRFDLHPYDYDPGADLIGLQAASALGLNPACTFKTLMCLADQKPVCVVIPSDARLDMKKLASVARAKSAEMMRPGDAEHLTGFKIGGISPFGQKKPVLSFIDETAQLWDQVYINAGARGLLLSIHPDDALRAAQGHYADVLAQA